MFGKAEWFKEKRVGWGLVPICRQGWIYTAVWSGVIILPFLVLLAQGLVFESLVWMAVAISVLVWDVRNMRRQIHAEQDVLYIDENETASSDFATRNYHFRLR